MKSRRVKIVLSAIAGVVVLLGGGWALMRSGGGFPTATIQVTGYTNDSSGQIVATLKVENTSATALAFYDYHSDSLTLDGEEAGFQFATDEFVPIIVAPHHAEELHLLLPRLKAGPHSWRCSFSVFKPNAREKTAVWLLRKNILSQWLYRFAELLPGESGPRTNVESPMFTLPANVGAP